MASDNRSGPVRTRRVDPGELKRQAAGGSRERGAASQRRSAASGRGSGDAGKVAPRQRSSGAGRTVVGAGKAGSQIVRRKPARAMAPEVLYVDGIEVRLQRKKVKNLNLRIARDGGHVDASAPAWMSPADVADFVRRKHDWIEAQMERVSATPMAQASQASKAEVAQWRAVVQACVPVLVAAWEPIMGVKAGQLAYRNMTSRWGSCQPSTGRICINVRLALYPPECLEYVVVHELCHLLERGHGPRFYQLMDRFMPDWKQRRDKLR
ncbi:MAG: SprT family zinc-dependent metalloprotease [Senegalimassilia anaerobia]